MALIFRNSRPYLYQSVRRNGRVSSVYRGSGEFALLLAEFDREDREARSASKANERNDIAEMESFDRAMADYSARIDELTHAVLIASGFHQHRRQWRKQRGKQEA